MHRKQGERLKHNEVKISILEKILSSKKEISEPDIRVFLRKKYGLIDQGTINRHLHSLQKEFGCLEKVTPIKKGLKNKWEVKNINNLKNIRRYFPEIQLNKYAKSLNLVFYEMDLEMNSIMNIKSYAQLSLSDTFFNLVLDKKKENIYKQIMDIYIDDKHSDNIPGIKKSFLDFYFLYIKSNASMEEFQRIVYEVATFQKTMSIDVWNRNFSWLEKALKIDMFLFLENEVSDRFYSVMGEEVDKIVNDKYSNWKSSPKDADFDINNIDKEIAKVYENFPKEELREKLFIKIYNEICPEHDESKNMEILTDRKMYIQLNEIISQMHQIIDGFQYYRFYFLLEHCYNHDRLIGVASKEELEYIEKFRMNFNEFIEDQHMLSSILKETQKTKTEKTNGDLEHTDSNKHSEIFSKWVLADLKTVSEIFVKYQIPLPSGEVHKKVEEAYSSLTEFFECAIPTNSC